ETWEIEKPLSRSLGAWRHLKLDLHTIDRVLLACRPDVDGRDDDGHLAGGWGLAKPATDLSLGSASQQGAVHVRGPARHRRARVDVLLDSVRGEPLRCQHRHLSRVHLLLRRNAQHTAEMVDVTVGVDHRYDGSMTAAMRAIERQRRRRYFGGHHR